MCFSPQRTLSSATVRNLASLHHQSPPRPCCPVSRRSRWSRIALTPPANVSRTCAPKPPTKPSGCVQPHRSPGNNTCWNWPAAVRSPRPAVSSTPPKWLVTFVATLHRPSIRPTDARRRHSIPAVHWTRKKRRGRWRDFWVISSSRWRWCSIWAMKMCRYASKKSIFWLEKPHSPQKLKKTWHDSKIVKKLVKKVESKRQKFTDGVGGFESMRRKIANVKGVCTVPSCLQGSSSKTHWYNISYPVRNGSKRFTICFSRSFSINWPKWPFQTVFKQKNPEENKKLY